jgi:hypothetical protein
MEDWVGVSQEKKSSFSVRSTKGGENSSQEELPGMLQGRNFSTQPRLAGSRTDKQG